MKRSKDKRINARHFKIRDYIRIFVSLIVTSAGYTMIYFSYITGEPSSEWFLDRVVVASLVGYLLLMALIFCTFMGITRNHTYSRPMRRISEAARRVAAGDFTVRLEPMRKDGKKDYVEVMFEDFNTMAEELSSIETMKSDFISNVSHEIKTPINVIQSYATTLGRDNLSLEQRKEYAATIVEASRKLTMLVTNILKLNKLENQEIAPVSAPYDLSEQLRQSALAFEELWESKNISFTADIADNVIVNYDESMLDIVWNNLLSNAIKFTGDGGSISLGLKTENEFAVISVTDTGCGMDEATGRHIFDKFYQGDTSHSQEGNGLGLALVMRVIEILGGGIEVDSDIGIGTTFTVTLRRETE